MEAADIQCYWKTERISDVHNLQWFFCGQAGKALWSVTGNMLQKEVIKMQLLTEPQICFNSW